jgi:hypothetical protein
MSPAVPVLLLIAFLGLAAYVVFTGLNSLLRFLAAPLLLRLLVLAAPLFACVAVAAQRTVPTPRRIGWLVIGLAALVRIALELIRARRAAQIR